MFQTAGNVVLIDAGPKSDTFDSGKRIVLPRLDKIGARGIDLIFLTHPDVDHVGGVGAIHKRFPKARIVISEQFKGYPAMEAQIRNWKMTDSDITWLGSGSEISIGDFSLSIRDPFLQPGADDNEGSMFIHLVGPAGSAVFSGDAGSSTEKQMEPLDDWSAQILKVGHHGSKNSTSASWLKEVNPRYAVISCGLNNMYGHPAGQTLTRLRKANTEVFRTDTQGDIRFDYDPARGFVPVKVFENR